MGEIFEKTFIKIIISLIIIWLILRIFSLTYIKLNEKKLYNNINNKLDEQKIIVNNINNKLNKNKTEIITPEIKLPCE